MMDAHRSDKAENRKETSDGMTQSNVPVQSNGVKTPLLGPSPTSSTFRTPGPLPYDVNQHPSSAVRATSSISKGESDQQLDYTLSIIAKDHAKGLSPKTNFKKRFENSWKAAQRFTRSQTIILSAQSSIELDSDNIDLKCSNCETLINLLKCYSGPATLSIPWAFKNSGLWTGLAGFLVIAFLSINCLQIVISCSEILERRTGFHIRNYEDLVELCFSSGPKSLQQLALFMRRTVAITLQVMQCGFCCFYIVFVASNVKKIIDPFWIDSPSIRVYEVLVSILLLPLAFVKHLKSLVVFSMFGVVIYMMAIVIIYQYILQDLPDVRGMPAFASWSTLPLFFGTSVFCFEGVGVVFPLRNRMKHPEDFGGFTGVLNLGIVIATALLAATGFYGYLRFGEEVDATLTLNLPHDQWLYVSVDAIFAAVAFISFGLQFYVPVNAMRPWLEEKMTSEKWRSRSHYLLRIGLFLSIFFVSIVVPHLELLTSLIGAVFGGSLMFILPVVVDTITQYEEQKLSRIGLLRNIFIMTFGLVGLVSGTYSSLVDIVKTF